MTRAVVLGHTGFVGRALVAELEHQGYEVIGHSSATLDLRDPEQLRRLEPVLAPDTLLFYLSALTPERGLTLDGLAANLTMTLNVARSLEAHPVRKCVYLSSDAVYPMVDHPVTESTPVAPSGLYALAKYAGERVLARVVETRGLALVCLRSTAVYGPGDTHGSYGPNLFVRSIAAERVVRLFGHGEESRDHVFIDDLATVAVRLAETDATGVINIATGQSYTFASVIKDLGDVVPVPFAVEHLPRKQPVAHRHFDTSRLRRALPGFRFTELKDGLQATWEGVRAATTWRR
jgi:nucleoside-diphosphate-sugar epimerase